MKKGIKVVSEVKRLKMDYQWNTRKFKGVVKHRFFNSFVKIGGTNQILVIQPKLLQFVNSLLTFTELTEATYVKKIVLLDHQLDGDLSEIVRTVPDIRIVFLVDLRADLTLPKTIGDVCKSLNLKKIDIIYCTWQTEQCNQLSEIPHFIQSQLKEYCENVKLTAWDLLPIPQFDDDFLCSHILYNSEGDSMYSPREISMKLATRGILVDNMVNTVESLLETTNTTITNVITIGNYSKRFAKTLKNRIESRRTQDDELIFESLHGKKGNNDIETDLIVIEREIDPITPLLTELTYLGILNDFFQFDDNGKVKDKNGTLNNFTNDDEIWNQLKFMNFGAMGPKLNKMAKDLQAKYDTRHDAETVGEIKTFVDSLGSLQQEQKILKTHTTLSSEILEEVENNGSLEFNKILELEQDILLDNLGASIAIERILNLLYEGQVSYGPLIQLISLLSLCKNGLKDNEFENIKKEFIDTFGIEICFHLESLTRQGLFTSKSLITQLQKEQNVTILKKEYKYASKWLYTIPDEEDDRTHPHARIQDSKMMNPLEPTFAYCGVAPLSIRLIQSLYDRTVLSKNYISHQPFIVSREPSCAQLQNLFHQLYGQTDLITEARWVPEMTEKLKRLRATAQLHSKRTPDRDIAIIVYLGGITPGELALIKFLQNKLQQRNVNKRFIIVADGITKRLSQ